MLRDTQILITGANGFVGRHLCAVLLQKGAKVTEIVRLAEQSLNRRNTKIELDLADRNMVSETFSALQPDYVIHLAAEKNRVHTSAEFRDSYDRNVLISLNVIEGCLLLPKFRRLIFLGSCDEYGQVAGPFDEMQREMPVNAYGLSKLAVTRILSSLYESRRFASVVLRPTVIYGPDQGDEMFLSALIQSLVAQRDFAMTYGEQCRDFIYIDDVVDAIAKTILVGEHLNGSVINIGAGISCQIKAIATLVADLIHPNAYSHLKFGSISYRPNEAMNYAVNIMRANSLLGWQPATKLAWGLRQTINSCREQVGAS